MKRIVVIVLMLVYGLSSTGATVHFHYCCGKLDDISFTSIEKKACSAKAISTKKCCDSKHVELKVKADQEPGTKWITVLKNLSTLVYTASYYLLPPTQRIPVNAYATGPPLGGSPIPLFIKNCVYRI